MSNTTDPVEVLLSSPRSKKAMEKLGYSKEDLRYLSKEEYKAKLGNMKIQKDELNNKWNQYETERKDKITQILEERKAIVVESKSREYSQMSASQGLTRQSKHARSVAYLPTKEQLMAQKQRQEYEMTLQMRKQIDEMDIKKQTQRKYDMLMQKEREQLQLSKLNKLRKQQEMKKLHDMAEFHRQYKTEHDMLLQKQEKIQIEQEIVKKREVENEKRRELEKLKQLEHKMKEEQFKKKTDAILNEQIERIEAKRRSLERFLKDKYQHIKHQEIEKEENLIKKKEDKIRSIHRALERNEFIKEQKKLNWLDKALQYEEKKQMKEYEELMNYQKNLEQSRKKDYYREQVQKRNLDLIEEKKNKTLWKLERIDLKNKPTYSKSRINSDLRQSETYSVLKARGSL